ncbi:MAG: TM2 domain-containing protein [Rhodospirillales bacterium]|nr:TM2 domain-containing protein [Rhodospirillales bacterium]
MDERTRIQLRYDAAKKSTLITYILWFFLGVFGVHRFYLRRIGSGIALLLLWAIGSLLTFIGVGYLLLGFAALWLIIDIFLIPGMVRDYNLSIIDELG